MKQWRKRIRRLQGSLITLQNRSQSSNIKNNWASNAQQSSCLRPRAKSNPSTTTSQRRRVCDQGTNLLRKSSSSSAFSRQALWQELSWPRPHRPGKSFTASVHPRSSPRTKPGPGSSWLPQCIISPKSKTNKRCKQPTLRSNLRAISKILQFLPSMRSSQGT